MAWQGRAQHSIQSCAFHSVTMHPIASASLLCMLAFHPPHLLLPLSAADAFKGTDHIRFPTRVVAKGADWLQLERPLPYDLRTRWEVSRRGRAAWIDGWDGLC